MLKVRNPFLQAKNGSQVHKLFAVPVIQVHKELYKQKRCFDDYTIMSSYQNSFHTFFNTLK
jgi:hypothetical protein